MCARFSSPAKVTSFAASLSITREGRDRFPEFYRLGIEPQLLISAEHGAGIEDLRALAHALPEIPDFVQSRALPDACRRNPTGPRVHPGVSGAGVGVRSVSSPSSTAPGSAGVSLAFTAPPIASKALGGGAPLPGGCECGWERGRG